MLSPLQLNELHHHFDRLQSTYGNANLNAIYGCGQIKNPKVMFLYMNPTARNVSASLEWKGIHAPWLGTKNVWKIYHQLGLITPALFNKTQQLKATEWTTSFCEEVYSEIRGNGVYVSNLAKCTQDDARPLTNSVFRSYMPHMLDEIYEVSPRNIITFGNQVSSVLLSRNISVSQYSSKDKYETLRIKDKAFKVFPVYYPVGQGMRNIHLAVAALKNIIS